MFGVGKMRVRVLGGILASTLTGGLFAATGAVIAQSVAQDVADSVAPESTTDIGVSDLSAQIINAETAKAEGRAVVAQKWMIAAANPYAVQAGARILDAGGSAADAMVAVQSVLGLVEPQSSGLGGGAFLVWFDAASGEITTLDGRETAPLAARPTLFQDENGAPLKFFDAVVGGRSVGVPGVPALMQVAHAKWGKLEWAGLFADGIDLAEGGFTVSPRLAGSVARDAKRLARNPAARAYFMPRGIMIDAGDQLMNPEYGDVLRTIAGQGAGRFYAGQIAKDIVAAVQDSGKNSGVLSEIDLSLYSVRERDAVCAPYREYRVCGMGPPSSGALAVGQILGTLEGYDLAQMGAQSPQAWRMIGDASRLAFADRGRYVADSDYVPVPVRGMLAPDYLAQRGALLAGTRALTEVSPGRPKFDHAQQIWADDDAIELPSTSHISIVDGFGNALSMTTTIENAFGSRVMVRGFLLNNELTDFSFSTHHDGVPIANRVEPGKRPRSSMAPTIVLRDGKPVLVVGSPGGSRIIGYVAKTIIAHLDWGMDVQGAIKSGHLVNRFGVYDIESGSDAEAMAGPLRDLGFEVKIRGMNSGLHAISIGDELRGGADPRREGIVLGR